MLLQKCQDQHQRTEWRANQFLVLWICGSRSNHEWPITELDNRIRPQIQPIKPTRGWLIDWRIRFKIGAGGLALRRNQNLQKLTESVYMQYAPARRGGGSGGGG